MTPAERMALLLQAQNQRQKMLGDSLPQPFDANRPVQEPEQSWLDKLSEAASGAGYGIADQLEGMGQMVRHPLDTLHSATVGISKAMDNPAAAGRAALEGIKQAAGEAVSSPFNMGRAVGANVTLNPRKLATMLDSPMVREMTVYHGTPYQFDKFDASKIGTGEGAQAYGHGLYFAESPDVAKSYQNALTHSDDYVDGQLLDSSNPKHMLARILSDESGNVEEAKLALEVLARPGASKSVANSAKQAIELLNFGERPVLQTIKPKGSLYHVDLPDEMVDRMLDWDKPLSEQPEAVRRALKTAWPDINEYSAKSGERLYQELSMPALKSTPTSGMSRAEASAWLRQQGIPGIRYLDAGSRGAGGSGTRNFVVFPGEEDKLKILERK